MTRPEPTPKAALIVAAALTLLTPMATAATYVVNPEGTGDFPTIQAAIEAAVDGDVIALTDGTFTGPGNRNMDFLGKAITVQSQSGDPAACVIDCQHLDSGFRFHSGEGPASVLAGVSITNGDTRLRGGAISCTQGAAPALSNCILAHNSADVSGGAVYCHDSSPTLTDCVFSENTCFMEGGGMDCRYGANPTLERCIFSANWADLLGGGICCIYAASPTFIECHFSENMASYGGGVGLNEAASPVLNDCTFTQNTCLPSGYGGALCSFWFTAPQVTACDFTDNAAGEGGAIYT